MMLLAGLWLTIALWFAFEVRRAPQRDDWAD